jgi:hypothetical protein
MARVYQHKKKEMRWLWKEDLRTNTVHIEDTVRALWHGADWYVKAAPRKPAPVFNIVDHGNTCKSYKSRRTFPFRVTCPMSVHCNFNPPEPASPSHLRCQFAHANCTTAQGLTAKFIHEVFNIETGFHGTLISAFAKLHLDHVVDEVNDETLDPWAELQQEAGISQSTPLTPFMEKELLRDADLSLDGSLFEKETGFTYVASLRLEKDRFATQGAALITRNRYKHEKLTKEGVEDMVESYKRMNWWP